MTSSFTTRELTPANDPDQRDQLDEEEKAELDTTACAKFLQFWTQVTDVQHITLVAILPDTQVVHARTFPRGAEDAACAWIADHQRTGRNIYFQPNETKPDCSKKPAKSDMVAALCRFGDADPDDARFPWAEERDRLHRLAEALRASEHPATAIIDSGNGIQPLWAFVREPLTPEVTARVEAETAALERALGAGGTHNVDRLLRLPGTLNFPNEAKRKRGRGVTQARLISAGSALYQPDQAGSLVDGQQLEAAGLVRPRPGRGNGSTRAHTVDRTEEIRLIKELEQAEADSISAVEDLTDDLQAHLAAAMTLDPETMTDRDYARRQRLADRWAGLIDDLTEAGRDDTHSGADMSLAAMLKAAGFSHLDTALILLAFRHGKANNGEWPAPVLRLRHAARAALRSHEPLESDEGGGWDEGNGYQAEDDEAPKEAKPGPAPFRSGWHGSPDPELNLPFAKTDKGKLIAKHQNNIRKAIAGCGVTLSYDEFADRELIEGPDNRPRRFYGDAEEKALYLQIDRKYGFLPPLPFFQIVASEFARRQAFHPVRQYLDHVQPTWDSVPRIGDPETQSWLTTYGGAPDNSHTRAVGRMVLVAAVRRVRRPGAKFDEILTLVTPKQGQNRSTAIEILAVNEEWFTDSLPIGADDKIVIEQTSGIWIGELADLHGKRGDVNKLKAFASRKRDRARLAYGHRREERPRQFILIATTNEDRPLTDVTGNRRYLMVRIAGFNLDTFAKDRDQLWAEAATIEATGESIRLAADLHDAASLQQEAHRERDTWEELLGDLLEGETGKIAAEELWAEVGKEDPGKRFQDDNLRLGAVMRALGWRRSRRRFTNLGRRCCYVKGSREQVEANTIIFPRKGPREGRGRP